MAEDIDDDDAFGDDGDDEMLEDEDEEMEIKVSAAKIQYDARRRVEQLMEEKALARLLDDDYYDLD